MSPQGDRQDVPRAAVLSAGGGFLWVGGLTTSTDLVKPELGNEETGSSSSGGKLHHHRSVPSKGLELDGRTDGFLVKLDMRSWKVCPPRLVLVWLCAPPPPPPPSAPQGNSCGRNSQLVHTGYMSMGNTCD